MIEPVQRTRWIVRGKYKWRPWWLFFAGWDFCGALHQRSLWRAALMSAFGIFMLLPAGFGKAGFRNDD